MAYFIRKIQIAMTLASVTSIGYVYGDYNPYISCGNRVNNVCCQPVCSGIGFISADLLYWRASENGLDECIPIEFSDTIVDGTVISRTVSRDRDPYFNWNPGFRIGAGYQFARSNLDIAAYWTHFHSNAHDSFNGNEFRWKINYDVVDLVAGYDSNCSSCFNLRPFAGLRGAKIDQELHANQFPVVPNDLIASESRSTQKFWGIGPIIGLEADVKIGCGFSIYAGAAVSLLYGDFDIHFTETQEFIDALSFCDVRTDLNASVAAFDAELGIRWIKCFCNRTQLSFELGLEHHRYFDYNRFDCGGDLSFDGLTFSTSFAF